ncbi:SGNH/GDSL hydrolase family protein [Solidesulfovibrio sp.]|uniref:SGNH/GDSL hydrolase family protein n=1 Tax=Solidesulfovibrio sp. TaxID=2910990 RepID=UPI00262E4D60|nr:SGNH/GDSL hydrolase family protein [Solidesulfovibrio sp.]
MRLVVAGDSLGLPRFASGSDKVDLYYEDTYPERLRRHLVAASGTDVMLVNLCRHAQTSLHLVRGLATDIYLVRPQTVIVQLGLADLWPARGRNTPPPLPDLADKDPWVDAAEYRRNMDLFLGFCRNVMDDAPPRVVLVNLWAAGAGQYERYPEALSRTRLYNAILSELAARHGATLFDAAALCRELGAGALCSDGIHWTPPASALLGQGLGALVLRPAETTDTAAAPADAPAGRPAAGQTPTPYTGVRHGDPTRDRA